MILGGRVYSKKITVTHKISLLKLLIERNIMENEIFMSHSKIIKFLSLKNIF